ncbi:unnamed protein product [Chrysoparadoxa australica]
MEEDPTPTISAGRRKSFILGPSGEVTGEEPSVGEGRKETGLCLERILLCEVPNLNKGFQSSDFINTEITRNSRGEPTYYNKLLSEEDCIIYEHVRDSRKPPVAKAFLRAGPRPALHFSPGQVNAAIVTCGGLCPGLNSVIHHLVVSLLSVYKCRKVWGIKGGFSGFHNLDDPPFELTVESVQQLQHKGGSLLGSSRGGFDLEKILGFLTKHQISQLFVIGGDGTHRGATKVAAECLQRQMNVAVAGIPKTIDNDIDIIDRSFGFMSAVEAAQQAIVSATTEARCNLPNGIGIVKLMGRSAGYIAAYATLASGDVDLCLIPECPIVLEGENGCLPHLEKRVQDKGYAVVVVAEGAGEELLGESTETDASGNKKLPAIGPFMKEQIEAYFERQSKQATVKYIDPSYMIRSVAASSFDQIYCMQIAQNAVHGVMAGYTAFSAGVVNNRTVYIPITELVESSPRNMNVKGRTWERVLSLTLQPNTAFNDLPLPYNS